MPHNRGFCVVAVANETRGRGCFIYYVNQPDRFAAMEDVQHQQPTMRVVWAWDVEELIDMTGETEQAAFLPRA